MNKHYRNQNIELSPHYARAILSCWLGRQVRASLIRRLHGGMCYAAFHLTFDCPPYEAVIKLDANPAATNLRRELQRINYLKQLSALPAPKAYFADDSGTTFPFAVLVLEALAGVNLEQAALSSEQHVQLDRELADCLLELHSHHRPTFGEIEESGTSDWLNVFLPRLTDLRQEMQTRLEPSVFADVDAAVDAAETAMQQSARPTLVHGDLWGGNILVRQERDGWHLSGVIDWPGLQYADVEYELAYLEAWNTVTSAFFSRYTAVNQLREGYEKRRLFYWLHTYMLHTWLFDTHRYKKLTAATAAKIIR